MTTVHGTTRVYGIIGDPVTHSLSPLMQNAALRACGVDAVYVPLPVAPAELRTALAGIRALNISGVNVTVPHKEAILPWLDEVDDEARRIGAVNTVVNRAGVLHGYNTDAPGLLAALEESFGFTPRQRRVLILGAGGACRAALVALASCGASWIGVANRSRERAEELVQTYRDLLPDGALEAAELTAPGLAGWLPQVDLLVNTSTVGLKGESFAFAVEESLPQGACVYDMVYARQQEGTPLVAAARGRGLEAADGRSMLAAQGERAFYLWTGIVPPAGLMMACLAGKTIDL